MAQKKERAPRSSNFTKEESDLLVALALKRKEIIECKLTDGETARNKNIAWEELTDEFNSTCPGVGTDRLVKVLREKYASIKRGLRKDERANERAQRKSTGGGKCEGYVEPKSDALNELCETLAIPIHGLPVVEGDDLESSKSASGSAIKAEHLEENFTMKDDEIQMLSLEYDKQINDFKNEDRNAIIGEIEMDIATSNIHETSDINEPVIKNLDSLISLKCPALHIDNIAEMRIKILKRHLEMTEEKHSLDMENRLLERKERQQRMEREAAEHRIKLKILEAQLDVLPFK